MNNEPLDEEAIFRVARKIQPEEARAEYLEQVCGSDRVVLERVCTLLQIHDQRPEFLESPCFSVAATNHFAPITERPRTRIGPYKLLEPIGEGGMGVVYMAEQREPISRKVALKIIKPGMDTRQVIARFEAERQALAMMDHPNIAKVLDAGQTEAGRPYFVMELVEGQPITEYCDSEQLSMQDRLELFVALCHGVQHAHQKGVIHRDLKPCNVLVEVHDVRPVPKIIDFGVAKALGQHLTDLTLHTGFEQMVGTPLYMSPEQAGLSSVDVDTRSDVYSLGVLLYELLTGHTPFAKDTLRTAGADELRRIIREVDPPRPSALVSTLAAAELSTISDRRLTEPNRLCRDLRGELDWIVMKALEKDRTRRYATANDLAQDVQRYLNDESVEACPPSTAYRLKKFVRRNRAALISAATVLLGLVAVLVSLTLVSLSQRRLADRDREIAGKQLQVQRGINEALAEVARLRGQARSGGGHDQVALSRAREQAQRALALAEAGPADPQLIAQVRRLDDELEQERKDRQLLGALDKAWLAQAQTAHSQNRFLGEAAIPQLEQALREYGIAVGQDDVQETASLVAAKPSSLRTALLVAFDEWRRALEPPLGISLSQTNDGSIVISSVVKGTANDVIKGDRLVGVGEEAAGQFVDVRTRSVAQVAKLLHGEAGTAVLLKVISPGQQETRICTRHRDRVAAWLRAVADVADPDPWRCKFREAVDILDRELRKQTLESLAEEVAVTKHPTRLVTDLANTMIKLGSTEKAISLLTKLRAKNPGDLWVNVFLGDAFSDRSRFDEAVRYYTAAVALQPDSAGLRLNLGYNLSLLGQNEDAAAEFREIIHVEPDYAAAHGNLANSLIPMGKVAEAIDEVRKAIQLAPRSAHYYSQLGSALAHQGKWQDAIDAHRKALQLRPDDPQALNNLGAILCDVMADYPAAEAQFREAIRFEPANASYHLNLAMTLQYQSKTEEALAVSREAVRLDPESASAHQYLGWCLASPKKPEPSPQDLEEAISHATKALELRDLSYPAKAVECNMVLGVAYYRKGSLPEAAAHLTKVIELADAIEGRSSDDAQWDRTICGFFLAMIRGRQGQKDEAQRWYDEAEACDAQWDRAICCFFLAMTRWRQGQKDEAQRWYDEAEAWRKKHKPSHVELLRFQTEAGELLGIAGSEGDDGQPVEKPDTGKDDESGRPSANGGRQTTDQDNPDGTVAPAIDEVIRK